MTSLTKNPQLPSKKIFFKCRLEDLSHLLRLLPGRVVYKWAYSLCRHLCLCSDAVSKKMHDALKPSLHCDEEPYNIEFCANLGPAHCDVGTFLMHVERKTV